MVGSKVLRSLMEKKMLSDLAIWKSVVGWEGCYEVSSTGLVRSLSCHGQQRSTPRYMRLQSHGQYYCSVVLKDRKTRRMAKRYVHRLVLEAFVGPCPVECQCDHIDGNGYNNNVSNLRWLRSTDNYRRRTATGGCACGPSHPHWTYGTRSVTGPEQWQRYEELKAKREEIRNGTGISCS